MFPSGTLDPHIIIKLIVLSCAVLFLLEQTEIMSGYRFLDLNFLVLLFLGCHVTFYQVSSPLRLAKKLQESPADSSFFPFL